MGMFNRKEKDQNKGIHVLKYTFAFFFFFLLCVCDRDRSDVRGRTCSGTSCTILSHWEAVVCCLTGTGTHIPAYRTPRPTASHQWRRNAICGVVHPLQFWLCLLIKKKQLFEPLTKIEGWNVSKWASCSSLSSSITFVDGLLLTAN